jgi:3,4-dihydroxy 2-butanone 4-phosphate synthase/GTP cyclohydrolase II
MGSRARARVTAAARSLATGGLAVVALTADDDAPCGLVCSGADIAPATVNRLATLGHSFIGVCLPLSRSRELRLADACSTPGAFPAPTISIDPVGMGTGISAADRALVIRLVSDPAALPGAVARPGHVFPLAAADGGTLAREGLCEAAMDLAGFATGVRSAVLCPIISDDGTELSYRDARAFARAEDLPVVSARDIVHARLAEEMRVEQLQPGDGTAPVVRIFEDLIAGGVHVARAGGDGWVITQLESRGSERYWRADPGCEEAYRTAVGQAIARTLA